MCYIIGCRFPEIVTRMSGRAPGIGGPIWKCARIAADGQANGVCKKAGAILKIAERGGERGHTRRSRKLWICDASRADQHEIDAVRAGRWARTSMQSQVTVFSICMNNLSLMASVPILK